MKQRAPLRNGTAVVPWESVPDLMYRVRGADGAIELLSAAFTTHTGWPVADWIGRPFSELVLAEDLPRATDRYTAILRGEKPTRSEMRIRTKAGGFVIGEFHGAPYVERGRVVGEQGIAREITDRRRRGEAREFGEERFRTLFESMDEALFLMDGPVFVDINLRGLEMFGLRDRSDIIGHSPVDFSPPLQPDGRESREQALAYILAALQGCPQRFYWQHARQDGTTFDAEVTLHALTLHGRVHVQATVRDISARRAAEQAMRESEKRFRLLAAHVPADVWTTDTDLRLTSIYGSLVPPVERLDLRRTGTSLYELFATRDESHPVIAAHRRALGGVSAQYERTAGPMVIEGRVEPLRNGAGAVVGCLGVALDVTERRSARSAVRRLADFVESSDDGIITTAPDGTIETWNPAAERLYGYPAREAVGRPITLIAPPDRVAEFQQSIQLLKQGQPVRRYEAQRARSDGGVISVSVTLSAIRDAGGAVVGLSGIVHDITERKQAEEALQASETRFRTLALMAPVGIFRADPQGLGTYINGRLLEIVGLTPEEAAGTGWMRSIHPDDRERVEAELAHARATGQPWRSEHRAVRPDGAVTWVLVQSAIERDDAGQVIGTIGTITDITELKRAEEALRSSEEMLRLVLGRLPIGVSLLGQDRAITYANAALERTLGMSGEDLVRGSHQSRRVVRPDGTPMPPEEFASARALREGRPVQDVEMGVITESGETIWASVSAAPLPKPEQGVVVTTVDISKRKRAEAALQASETRYRSLIEHSMDLVVIMGADGRFTYASPSVTRLLGYDPKELIGQVGFGYLHADDVQRIQAAFGRALQGDTASIREVFRFRHKDGSWRAFESVVTNLLGEPTVAGVVINSRDITDRTSAEEALRHSESEYRGLVVHAPLGIYRSTRDGRILTVNPALVTMLGYAGADEVLGLEMAHDVYADPEDRARLLAKAEQRDEAKVETQWKKKEAGLITVRLNVRLVRDPAGAVEYFEGLVEDVTEQRSLENQFRQAQRLEAVGRLAGGVAHDFNNILTAISGYSELLLADLDRDDPKRQDVEEILAATQRAAALTRQLLAFSRKQVLQTRVLDLNSVIRTIENMLRRLIGEDVKLEVSLDPALGAVRADPGQIEQVILNLAVNSRDAMPGGGRLTIETANVNLDEAYVREHAGASPGSYVMLAVSDTGVGMDAEVRSQIFEPFFTTKEQGKGTGLGLAVVHGIVQQSGGSVWVYSEPGRGATFKVYLPRVDEPVEAPDLALAEQPAAGGGETVLLAEDDPSVREVVADVLTRKGYRVLRAPDGQTALEVARAESGEIKLLVTDIVMPGMTGRELAEALTVARPGVRVLYMSGYTDDAVVRHRVLEEGLPYLQKPFTPGALAFKVRAALDRS